jgi:hypothetical protein
MSGWRGLISGAVAALGALAFLAIVANEIERLEWELERWEARERKVHRQRQNAAAVKVPRTESNNAA